MTVKVIINGKEYIGDIISSKMGYDFSDKKKKMYFNVAHSKGIILCTEKDIKSIDNV